MSKDGGAFIRAICAAPDDDLPRLVYADFLDEAGEWERAAFIRVQCELAQLQDAAVKDYRRRYLQDGEAIHQDIVSHIHNLPCLGVYDAAFTACDACVLGYAYFGKQKRRERELLAGDSWIGWTDLRELSRTFGCADYGPSVGRIADSLSPGGERRIGWQFRRGFIESVTCTAADALAHLRAVREREPVTRCVLTTWPEGDDAIILDLSEGPLGEVSFRGHRLGLVRAVADYYADHRVHASDNWRRKVAGEVMGCEFPGVRFELPPAVEVWRGESETLRGAVNLDALTPTEAP
jgi:uncharacterized protein (TIGR02996 family)